MENILNSKPTDLSDAWDNPNKIWPSVVYVETSSLCNYRCPCCHNWEMKRPKRVMSFEEFKFVADKIKQRRVIIGAMYCNAEPFTDSTILQKCAYAKSIDVLEGSRIGLNTNGSLLTPDKYDLLLETCPNITISVFATGEDYATATGGFSWEKIYSQIINFIQYRDKHKPEFNIYIGCNQIPGNGFDKVANAFKDYQVEVVTDVFINWNNPKELTGPLSRLKMFPWWKCDGLKGALQIRPDGACGYCAYDFHGDENGLLETYIGNFFTDSWETLETNFRAKWKSPSVLCQRCDYWKGARNLMEEYP